jgi:hypothetical protein
MFPSFRHTPTRLRLDLDAMGDRIRQLEEGRAAQAGIIETLAVSNRDLNLRVDTLEEEAIDGATLRALDPFTPLPPMPLPLRGKFPSSAMAMQECEALSSSLPQPSFFLGGAQVPTRAAVARILGEAILSGIPRSPSDLRQAVAKPLARDGGAERIGEAILARLEAQT